jgi:hypothetical protein
MKSVLTALVLGICAVGASATVATTHSAKATMTVSHQATSSALPIPNCNPSGCK